MFYLKVVAPTARTHQSGPRDIVQGPFASVNEAQGYWTKLEMWFPETMEGANYRIMDHEVRGEIEPERNSGR